MLSANLPENAVQMIENTDREAVTMMLQSTGQIDVIIPRGGKSLVEKVQQEARVPVFALSLIHISEPTRPY